MPPPAEVSVGRQRGGGARHSCLELNVNLWNCIELGLKESWAHKVRSLLTMFGIILGVASLVAMSALVKGMEKGAREALIAIGGLQKIRVEPADVPNPNWLRPGAVSAGQQAFGDALLKAHPFVLIPSMVSTHSWNVICDPAVATGLYGSIAQERFALDPRLHPPA